MRDDSSDTNVGAVFGMVLDLVRNVRQPYSLQLYDGLFYHR